MTDISRQYGRNWKIPGKQQVIASDEMGKVVIERLQSDRGVHAETAIAGAARIAGTFLLRSFHLPYDSCTPGTPVFSDAANDHGPLLLSTVEATLRALKFPEPYFTSIAVPEEHKPHLTIDATRKLLEPPLRGIAVNHSLAMDQAAHACAIVAAKLIRMSAKLLPAAIGFALCQYGFVEGLKTVPEPGGEWTVPKRWFKW